MTKNSKKKPVKGPTASPSAAATLIKRKRSVSTDRQSSVGHFQTPPTSPASPQVELPMIGPSDEPAHTTSPSQGPIFTADEIASGNQDIATMADVFATMKKTLVSMTGNLEQLGNQSDRVLSFARDFKAADQVWLCFLICDDHCLTRHSSKSFALP